jgi:hypothetical protein
MGILSYAVKLGLVCPMPARESLADLGWAEFFENYGAWLTSWCAVPGGFAFQWISLPRPKGGAIIFRLASRDSPNAAHNSR